MSMQHGSGFRICGVVLRKFTNSAGTFAALDLSVDAGGRTTKIEGLKGFDEIVVNEIAQLVEGAVVEVTGAIGMEGLKNKDKTEVKRDGRNAWAPLLTIKKIKVEASSVKPAETPDLDDVRF